MAKYKIHPAIGIARVGDSDSFFIGPEYPGADATYYRSSESSGFNTDRSFKSGGKIKRQAARFRIWKYDDAGTPLQEMNIENPDIEYIKWSVHLLNKKAAFYQCPSSDDYKNAYAGVALRNGSVVGTTLRKTQLVIDGGERTLEFSRSETGAWKSGPKFSAAHSQITYLGELRADRKGRLVVLGGKGVAKGTGALSEAFNNDGWFDDVADGPVKAWIKFKDQPEIEVDGPAWVITGPPDYAPPIGNVVSLYDLLIDFAVRRVKYPDRDKKYNPAGPELIKSTEGLYKPYTYTATNGRQIRSEGLSWLKELYQDWKTNSGKLTSFKPSFSRDIFPILYRGLTSDWVQGGSIHASRMGAAEWKNLGEGPDVDPADPYKDARNKIFDRLRPPDGPSGVSRTMPLLQDPNSDSGDLHLTRTQYAMMERWKDGHFMSDWNGRPQPRIAITPEGLDQAALENCVGGAFYPGIEVSWIGMAVELYVELFRLKPGVTFPGNSKIKVEPGLFTQQMAVPWQTDFLACGSSWWPGQRPVNVKVKDAANNLVDIAWDRSTDRTAFATGEWKNMGFILRSGDKFIEKEGKPVPAPASSVAPSP